MQQYPAIAHPAYTEAIQAYERIKAEHAEAQADFLALRGKTLNQRQPAWPDGTPRYVDGALADAVQADDADQAEAIRLGRRPPARKRTEQVQRQIAAADERARVLAEAERQAHAEVRNVIAREREALRQAAAEQARQAQDRLAEAVQALRQARADYYAQTRLDGWLRTYSPNLDTRYKGANATPPPITVPGVRLENTPIPLDVDRILDVLAAEAVHPEDKPAPTTHRWEPYREQIVNEHGYVNGVRYGARRVEIPAEPPAPDTNSAMATVDGALLYLGDLPDFPDEDEDPNQ